MAPPSPPVPVPSKAAIRALRGLVLGTTCTLALVTEDRRRRINAARSALRNGDRLRSARQYHPGGSAFAIALEEDSLSVEPAAIHWNTTAQLGQGSSRTGKTGFEPATSRPSRSMGTAANWSDAMLVPAPIKRPRSPARKSNASAASIKSHPTTHTSPDVRTSPELQSSAASAPTPLPRVFTFPAMAQQLQKPSTSLEQQSQEYVARAQLGRLSRQSVIPVTRTEPVPITDVHATNAQIKELSEAKGSQDLPAAVRALASAWATIEVSPDQQTAIGEASAKLCKSCQAADRMDLAQEVLQLAVKFGQLNEATYFAHHPLRVVLSLAPLDALQAEKADAAMVEPGATARRDLFVKRLQDAADLFLPTFASQSAAGRTASDNLASTAKQLLACAFAADHHGLVNRIYASTARFSGDNIFKVQKWFHSRLQKAGNHALLVSHFVAQPPPVDSLSKPKFKELGDWVVEATRLSHFAQAGPVFEALVALSASTSHRLRTPWVTDLLYGQWQKTKDYAGVESLFRKLEDKKKSQDVPSSAYRVMVQIALEAGRAAEAKALFSELVALVPSAANDIRMLGIFALAKAKAGDWDGVRGDFQQAVAATGDKGLNPRDAERIFAPIAKEYILTHTIDETEAFLKMYVEEIGIPRGSYMFTLLANKYGALREKQSLAAWLEYCLQSGFAADAGFTNAIVGSLKTHWKLGFEQVREVYLQLRTLGPNMEDKVTQSIMAHAAISDAQSQAQPEAVEGHTEATGADTRPVSPTPAKSRRASASSLSADRHYADAEDLYVSMRKAFALNAPAKVVGMFKHAVRSGMPPSTKCLKLAVAAAVKSGQPPQPAEGSLPNLDAALDLLETAHNAGQDVNDAAAYVAIAYIDAAGQGSGHHLRRRSVFKANVAAEVKSILLRLDNSGVTISDLVFNRAAFHMLKAHHLSGAVALAMSAANSPAGGGCPGYNVWNYCVLIEAFSRTGDAAGICNATKGAAASGCLAETKSYNVLKQARRRLLTLVDYNTAILEDATSGKRVRQTEGAAAARRERVPRLEKSLQAVEDALEQARTARQQLRADRDELKSSLLRIMQQSVYGTANEPADVEHVDSAVIEADMTPQLQSMAA